MFHFRNSCELKITLDVSLRTMKTCSRTYLLGKSHFVMAESSGELNPSTTKKDVLFILCSFSNYAKPVLFFEVQFLI